MEMIMDEEISGLRIMSDIVVFMGSVCLIVATYMFVRPIHTASIECSSMGAHWHKIAASTVSDRMLAVLCLLLPACVIMASECMYHCVTKTRKRSLKVTIFGKHSLGVHAIFAAVYKYLGSYLAGQAFVTILTTLAKGTVGRMRPYYLTLCDPVYNLRNHSSLSELCASRPVLYNGVDFECRCSDTGALLEAQYSFPSGHASQSFFAMVFLCLYVGARWKRYSRYLTLTLQSVLIAIASFTALTRISDSKHFFSDVAVGTLLGVCGAVWTFCELALKRRSLLHDGDDNCKRYSLLRVNACSRSSSQEAANKELV